jgi:hypothetical protein
MIAKTEKTPKQLLADNQTIFCGGKLKEYANSNRKKL